MRISLARAIAFIRDRLRREFHCVTLAVWILIYFPTHLLIIQLISEVCYFWGEHLSFVWVRALASSHSNKKMLFTKMRWGASQFCISSASLRARELYKTRELLSSHYKKNAFYKNEMLPFWVSLGKSLHCEFLGDRDFWRQINVLDGVEQFYTFFKGTLKSFAAGN